MDLDTGFQKIEYFFDIVRSNYGLFYWEYNELGVLVRTNCHWPEPFEKFFIYTGCKNSMLEWLAEHETPVLLCAPIGMQWAAATSGSGSRFVLGPALQGAVSDENLTQILEIFDRSIAESFSGSFIALVRTLPIITVSSFQQLTLMMSYGLSNHQYKIEDIHYQNNNPSSEHFTPAGSTEDLSMEYYGRLRRLLHGIQRGQKADSMVIDRAFLEQINGYFPVADPLRNIKYAVTVFGTLCARFAVDGGLLPENAYALSSFYIKNVDSCRTISEAVIAARTMYTDFVSRIHKSRVTPGKSREVQDCCKYIQLHVEEKLTVSHLASMSGYTEYYFTRKFKRETGQSLTDYIKLVKVEQAAFWLKTTTRSIQEISDCLCFPNRNAFTTVFYKFTGLPPAAYRKQKNELPPETGENHFPGIPRNQSEGSL